MLVALLVPEHEHHTLARYWFEPDGASEGWATCAVTELGVIRVCAQLPGGSWLPETTVDRLLLLTAARRNGGRRDFWSCLRFLRWERRGLPVGQIDMPREYITSVVVALTPVALAWCRGLSRVAGHGVSAIAELSPGAEDDVVLARACSEARVLFTEDKDFGHLAFGSGRDTPGVVLIRFPAGVRSALAATMVNVVAEAGDRIRGAFVRRGGRAHSHLSPIALARLSPGDNR